MRQPDGRNPHKWHGLHELAVIERMVEPRGICYASDVVRPTLDAEIWSEVGPKQRLAEDHRMLNGVVVDSLTQAFLDLAIDSERREEIHQSLRGYFHDARNRLSVLKIGLYVARRSGSLEHSDLWRELDVSYRGLEVLVDRIQTLCRPSAIEPCAANLGVWLEERRSLWTTWFAARGRPLLWFPPTTNVSGWFDPARLIEALDALLAWRAGTGRPGEPARVSWSADPISYHLDFLEESATLSETNEGGESRSISMALPLLARVMTTHQGTLSVADRNGLSVRLAWPIQAASAAPA